MGHTKQFKIKKYIIQVLACLDKAIALNPNYRAGRKRAEEQKVTFIK